ncbi:SMEK domain-containing protein [Ruminiclostridium cellobioparum]|uniref:SMEK domain-containing protein n=1 Tax=Ruminiclostridium cellobioparum TaxID=29355 RepID=UPI0004886A6F|nr:SMEK domain-containing protein [Ruminiclostridium cellobioparum]
MKKSDDRIQYIADYISAYEEKIKLLNINGLFDAAKLFELFAIEVGSLYFGQRLSNLNIDTYTYPCVDLISADKQTYIQVSTVKDIPAKIKTTLENIRDSKLVEINTLTNVKFFMLSNDSVDKVKDYTGNDQIGSISFTKANDLITTKDILQKATVNLDFQIAVYELFKRETESVKDNSYKFREAIENSKTVGLGNIDCKINNEYEIDRSELISKIKADNHINISIQGGAGSGKSVLCKKIVEEEANLIYARAERFLEETDINNIWGFNVRKTLEYLNGKPVVFFIDSLEFIADSRTKLDLLCALFECTKKYPSAKIITSCRTSDKNAFMKIESNYSIYSYEASELTITEQLAIAKKYPIINKMCDMNSYTELLKSPFYINLIVSKITDIDDISDENQLREYIWQNIICLGGSEIKKVVESIAFTRAKDFSLGANSSDYDTGIIKNLISQGVVVSNGKTVRLKYDIFEDICFEQHLDNEFNKCKGKYNEFFDEIETFGRCIYRRYQIWISNKLFAQDNREKFLYELVFSSNMPIDWRKQTEIGLVKSRHCSQFFKEYGQTIIKNGMLNDFLRTTNLYAFEINGFFKKLLPYIQIRPSGEGRGSLINLIIENRLYEKDEILRLDLEKICTDYSKVQLKEKQTAEEACIILEYIIEKFLVESEEASYYKLDDIVNRLLVPIYQMAEYSKDWIKEFWGRLKSYYKGENRDKKRLAEDIIEDTLKFKHTKLAEHLPTELCDLAEMFWTYTPRKSHNNYGFYERERDDRSYQYGLSKKAEEYEHGSTRSTAIEDNFFCILFRKNFWEGLNWAISFVNKAVSALAEKHEGGLFTYEINFVEDNLKKSYIGISEMWLATLEEHRMPMVISDLLFCLKEELRSVIENDAVVNKETTKFAYNVSKLIYDKSNNIALLSIIADIGMEFRQKLPSYALDLTTNIDIILHDLTRQALLIKNPVKEMFEKQILMTVGMPSSLLPDRYNKKNVKQYNLLDYVIDSQIYYGEEIKIRCHKILDYLYSVVPNDKENATEYLQIQKMDLRTAQVVNVDDTTVALVPTVTGEAEKITIENEKQRQPESRISSLINNCNKKISNGGFKLSDCLEAIQLLLESRENCIVPGVYDKILIDLIIWALHDKTLDENMRSRFCQIWISGIRTYFTNGSFIFEYSYSWVLFTQIESNVCDETKNQIKQLIIDLIMYKGQHGVVAEIARYTKRYLATNEQLARTIFNTIIKLAEDEMNHQKFNAEYMKKNRQKEKIKFSPNIQPKLRNIDFYIKTDKKKIYKSQRDEIIREYLFNKAELELSNFDMDNYDITTLCYAINCGLSLRDTSFAVIVKKFVVAMINVWKENQNTHHSHDILDVYSLYEVMDLFQRELVANEIQTAIVLDILFTGIDFSKFTRETIEFYQDVFGSLLAHYFDSHSDKDKRAYCENIIHSLEDKIIAIKEEKVKVEFYKSLILSNTRYGGSGDWSKFPSGYSYQDKQFLNDMFSKYGGFHLKEMLNTSYKLHLDKLLPEILLSVRDAFKNAPRTNKSSSDMFAEIVRKEKTIILILITKAFLDFSDKIKQDDDLTKAFEEILEMLVEISYEEAATILDEFRVH